MRSETARNMKTNTHTHTHTHTYTHTQQTESKLKQKNATTRNQKLKYRDQSLDGRRFYTTAWRDLCWKRWV